MEQLCRLPSVCSVNTDLSVFLLDKQLLNSIHYNNIVESINNNCQKEEVQLYEKQNSACEQLRGFCSIT